MRYFVLDTETTGFGPESKVCEIAWVEIDHTFEVIGQWESLIDPEIPISPGASGVHRITNDLVADSPTIEQMFSIVHPGKIPGPCVIAGHNVRFDLTYVDPWCEKRVGEICTLRLARKYYPELDNHKLATILYALNLGEEVSHRAMGDVITTLRLMRRINKDHGVSLKDMGAEADKPIFLHSLPFGKHRGTPILDVPKDYLKWLSRQDNIDKDLAYTLEKVLSM